MMRKPSPPADGIPRTHTATVKQSHLTCPLREKAVEEIIARLDSGAPVPGAKARKARTYLRRSK